LNKTPKIPIIFHLPTHPLKRREAVKLNSTSIFEIKSALNSANYQIQMLNPVQHFPLHCAKSFISGKELHYKYLEHHPQFLLSISLTRSASLERNAAFQSEIVNGVRPFGIYISAFVPISLDLGISHTSFRDFPSRHCPYLFLTAKYQHLEVKRTA
jgi:hypothetical protein